MSTRGRKGSGHASRRCVKILPVSGASDFWVRLPPRGSFEDLSLSTEPRAVAEGRVMRSTVSGRPDLLSGRRDTSRCDARQFLRAGTSGS